MNFIQCDGFTLEIVKLPTGWAQKATMDNISRYRFYHYKKEAREGLLEWTNYPKRYFEREFYHNFFSLKDLEGK